RAADEQPHRSSRRAARACDECRRSLVSSPPFGEVRAPRDKWVDRGRGLPIWAALEALGPALDDAGEVAAHSPSSAADIAAISRLRAALAYIGKRLAGVDSYLLVPGPLETVTSALNEARPRVQAYTNEQEGTEAL